MTSQTSLTFAHGKSFLQISPDCYGLTKLVGEEHIYDSLPDVLDAYWKETKQVEAGPGVSEKGRIKAEVDV